MVFSYSRWTTALRCGLHRLAPLPPLYDDEGLLSACSWSWVEATSQTHSVVIGAACVVLCHCRQKVLPGYSDAANPWNSPCILTVTFQATYALFVDCIVLGSPASIVRMMFRQTEYIGMMLCHSQHGRMKGGLQPERKGHPKDIPSNLGLCGNQNVA